MLEVIEEAIAIIRKLKDSRISFRSRQKELIPDVQDFAFRCFSPPPIHHSS